jgi:hypothetical protein
MKDFSITKTAFSGYRLLATKPLTTLCWFIFSLLVTVVTIGGVVVLAGPELTALQQMRDAGQADPASMTAISQRLRPYELFSAIFPWLTGAVTLGAATRAVLKPQASAVGYLRFGVDELRLLMTSLVIIVLVGLAAVVAAIMGVIGLVATAGPAGLGALRQGGSLGSTPIIVACVAALPGLALTIFLATQFSLAPAETVARRAVRIFGSWGLIKGRFWKVLAVYVLAVIPVLILEVLATYATMVAAGGGHGSFMQMAMTMQSNMSSLSAAFGGSRWIGYILTAVGRTFAMAALLVPAAVIYQAVTSETAGAAADDDDDDDDDDYDDED